MDPTRGQSLRAVSGILCITPALAVVLALAFLQSSVTAATHVASMSVSATVVSRCDIVLSSAATPHLADVNCSIPVPYQVTSTAGISAQRWVSAANSLLSTPPQELLTPVLPSAWLNLLPGSGFSPHLVPGFVAFPPTPYFCSETSSPQQAITVSIIY